ncbi:MAG: S-layer protein [Methanospirillum sp.]
MFTSQSPRIAAGCAMAALLLLLALAPPVLAGERFSANGPEISASIEGTNELAAGQTVPLIVVIQNAGLVGGKEIGLVGTAEPLPNTAKSVNIALEGTDGIVVQSDPQMVGDILGGQSARATFRLLIPADVSAGTYTLPLKVSYSYVDSVDRIGTSAASYQYLDVDKTIPLALAISSRVVLRIDEIATEALNVGTEGYLNLTVTNAGAESAKNAVVALTRNLASPITPIDSSVFIGDFAPGQTVHLRYKVAVSDEAAAQAYPVHFVVSYDDHNGIGHTEVPVTIGVPVGGSISFEVVSPKASIPAGGKQVIDVVYRNTGAAVVRSAQARLSAVAPFVSTDDSAYLGDMAPGENRTARFEISAKGDATPKDYALDSEIRYRDALGNTMTSDSITIPVTVTGSTGSLGSTLGLGLVGLVIIGGVWVVYRRRKGPA